MPSSTSAGRCWRPTAHGTWRCAGCCSATSPRGRSRYETFLRGLTATALDACPAERRHSTSSRRSAPTSRSGCWYGCSACRRRRPAHRLGQPDDRQHRPRRGRRPARVAGERGVPRPAVPLAGGTRGVRVRPTSSRSSARWRRRDLVSKLVNRVPEDGVPLSEQDFHNYFLLLIVAGQDDPAHDLALHEGAHRLPGALARLKERPVLLPPVSRSSCAGPRRCTTSAVPRPGTPTSAGLPSSRATRSCVVGERQPRPRVFRTRPLRRPPRRARAHGVRQGRTAPLPGQPLARMEIRIMFEEILARVDAVEHAGPVRTGAQQLRQRHQGVCRSASPAVEPDGWTPGARMGGAVTALSRARGCARRPRPHRPGGSTRRSPRGPAAPRAPRSASRTA